MTQLDDSPPLKVVIREHRPLSIGHATPFKHLEGKELTTRVAPVTE